MDYARNLRRERKKLLKSDILDKAKKAILDFIDDEDQVELSYGRKYAYILRLRRIAGVLQDSFNNPTKEQIKDFMSSFRKTMVRWGSGKEHNPSDNSNQAYQVTLKKFYKWYLGNNEDYPDCVKWIKITTTKRSKETKPKQGITQQEFVGMLNSAMNPRDRALLSLLYGSGCRISELLGLDIKDIEIENDSADIIVCGKTGVRTVTVPGDTLPYLQEWLENHPVYDPNAPLFTRMDGDVRERMTYEQAHSMLRKVSKRAGIKRRIYPHLFRHTRATLLSTELTEPVLEKVMGWVHGSRMSQVYVHLNDKTVKNQVLKAYGIEVKDDHSLSSTNAKPCPRCHTKLPSFAKI